jgi:DNA primase catalytic core
MAISPETIAAIKNKADIVTVISSYLEVVKKGTSYAAVCPFHHDTNPSLMISPAKQLFKCFVCGTGGNVFTFVMKYENIGFIEAVKKVCSLCKIDLPEELATFKAEPKKNQEELTALDKLSQFYSYMLKTKEGLEAMSYLKKRGLDEPTIAKFRLGYAPNDQSRSTDYLRNKEKIPVQVLDNAGIISANSGQLDDRYKDRIMFPLSDIRGDLVGFSGRRYREGNTDAKYINSPDSLVFHKSEILYNCNNALPFIRHDKCVYVLEGFMDVIALDRVGIYNAVGLMGTALTKEHIDLFRRMNAEVRLSLDADEPGQAATERCLALLESSGLNVKVVKPLTGGKDADEVLKSEGPEALKKAMNDLELPILHSLDYQVKRNLLPTYEAKQQFLRDNKQYYLSAPALAKEDMLNSLAQGLAVSGEAIKSFLANTPFEPIVSKPASAVSEVEETDLSNKEVNSCLVKYITPRLADARLHTTRSPMLIRTETQILSRLTISKEAYEAFQGQHDAFVLPSYRYVFGFISDCYGDLRNSVDYLKEEDYDRIIGFVEIYYANLIQDLAASKEAGTKDEEEAAEFERRTILGIIDRLKDCLYPSKTLNEKEFKELLNRHTKQKWEYDSLTVKLDDKSAVNYLQQLDSFYKKNPAASDK